jgi:hypothetical protein
VSTQRGEKKKKKENKCVTGNLNSTFIEELESNSKSCDHCHLVRQIDLVVEIHRTVVEVGVEVGTTLVVVLEIVVVLETVVPEQSYHPIVEMMVVDQNFVGEPRMIVVELLVVELELGQGMGEDMVEEQGMAEELEQEQKFVVVVIVLLAIVDKVASMAHQLLALNASCPLVELHRQIDS